MEKKRRRPSKILPRTGDLLFVIRATQTQKSRPMISSIRDREKSSRMWQSPIPISVPVHGSMSVLWRSDSKAFALTATLIKLGSEVSVYLQEGNTFRKIKLPKLSADIPEKIKRGKSFPHVSELDSWSAKQWQKDGSLIVEIENMVDGNDGSITATRTVVLGFDRSDKPKALKSTIKLAREKS